MEINRTDNLGLERSRSYPSAEQQLATGEEEQAVKQKQAVAPPKAPDKGAQGQGAASPGSEMASAAQSANAQAVSQMATGSTEEEDDDSAYQAILAKLNAGQSLTPTELSTLRSKNAAKYSQALQAQSARSQLRAQMEEDPAHAVKTAREAMARVAGASNEEKSAVLNAMQKESADFTSKYDQVEFSRLAAQQAATLARDEE